ncbi:hypothetical protein MALGJ_07510 [Mycolicibacter algericus]|uniref:Uncharacterized protein n=1 Tax=Mycolicibacter algericus TaxID=1288388 RepID=A0A7I9Y5X3_MYCAL|nr:hypothetical protein MALGJ_07510 [Mycolicibacter algericus]
MRLPGVGRRDDGRRHGRAELGEGTPSNARDVITGGVLAEWTGVREVPHSARDRPNNARGRLSGRGRAASFGPSHPR